MASVIAEIQNKKVGNNYYFHRQGASYWDKATEKQAIFSSFQQAFYILSCLCTHRKPIFHVPTTGKMGQDFKDTAPLHLTAAD